MAKQCKIEKNAQRKHLVAKYRDRRVELIAVMKDPNATPEAKWEAQVAIAKMPRDASPVRVRNRCVMTGRSRAVYRKFGLCRITFREEALKGNIPGVVKSSW